MQSEINTVATVLADPENADLTAEEVAEKVISALDAKRAATHNLIVVGRFGFPDSPQFEAALGPLSTRAKTAARQLGEGFAWDYKTKIGNGRYKLLPILRHPRAAWDFVRTKMEESTPTPGRENPHLPLERDVQLAISEAMAWVPDPALLHSLQPACSCASPLERFPNRTSAGDLVTANVCPRHPEGHP